MAGGDEMSTLVGAGHRTPLTRMMLIEQDARAQLIVKHKKSRNRPGQRSHEDPHPDFQLEQRDDVCDGCNSETQPMPKLHRGLLGLFANISREDGSLWWIARFERLIQCALEFGLCGGEVAEQLGCINRLTLRNGGVSAKTGYQIRMNGIGPKQGINGGTICLRHRAQLVMPNAP